MYPFVIDNIHHETFGITFLQSVILKLRYSDANEDLESFNKFMSRTFNLEVDAAKYGLKNNDSIKILESESSKKIKFTRGVIEFRISGADYKNFQDSLLPFLKHVSDFLTEINSEVLEFKLEMIDLWPLLNSEKYTPNAMKRVIFSDELYDNNSQENMEFKEWMDGNDALTIRYGFIPGEKGSKSNSPRIALDSICNSHQIFPAANLLDVAKRFSDVLYASFLWSVSKKVKNVMRQYSPK